MSAFTGVMEHIEAAGKDDDDLIFMGLIAEEIETTEGRIVSAAIVEILCKRHPEIADQVAVYMDDYESPLNFVEFLAHAIKN